MNAEYSKLSASNFETPPVIASTPKGSQTMASSVSHSLSNPDPKFSTPATVSKETMKPTINAVHLEEIYQHLLGVYFIATPRHKLEDDLEREYTQHETFSTPMTTSSLQAYCNAWRFHEGRYDNEHNKPTVDPAVQRGLLEMVRKVLRCLFLEYFDPWQSRPENPAIIRVVNKLRGLYEDVRAASEHGPIVDED